MNVNFELTDHCNLRCRMCSQAHRQFAHGRPQGFMDWRTWRALLEGLEGMPEPVDLCPHWLGEPTVHPAFDAMVEYAFVKNTGNRLFRSFKLHTNAVLLGPERIRRLLRLAEAPHLDPATFETVHFSLDAATRQTYREVKGADRHEAATTNTARFLEIRSEWGLTWPHVHLAFVVQPENQHEVEAFVTTWSERLEAAGARWRLTGQWPSPQEDAIYLRRLNCRDQAAADALHARACHRFPALRSTPTRRPPEAF